MISVNQTGVAKQLSRSRGFGRRYGWILLILAPIVYGYVAA